MSSTYNTFGHPLLRLLRPNHLHCRYTVGLYSTSLRHILVIHNDSVEQSTEEDAIAHSAKAIGHLTEKAKQETDQDARYFRVTTRVMLQPREILFCALLSLLLCLPISLLAELVLGQLDIQPHTIPFRFALFSVISLLFLTTIRWSITTWKARQAMRELSRHQPSPDDPFRVDLPDYRLCLHTIKTSSRPVP